jgi:phosphatidylserine/phosphatidylglycerophosphate/cardiolipin synthase-like enzyme
MKLKRIKTLILITASITAFFISASAKSFETIKSESSIINFSPESVSVQVPSKSILSGETKSYSDELVIEPDDARTPVLNLINSASRSIDITIYTISDSQIVTALVNAAKKGISVRVIYNYDSFAKNNIYPNDAAINKITAAGGKVVKAGTNFTITHQKTITVDGKTSLIMTFNLSASYFSSTRDFGYITSNSSVVNEIEKVFDADFNYSAVSVSEPSLVWSPNNSKSKILDIINSAKKTLFVDNEETADKTSMSAIMDAAKRGVKVRFLTAVLKSSSTTDANAAERDVLNAAGVYAKATSNHYMHGKMIISDYDTSDQKAFIGSDDFSYTSLNMNRELGVIFNDSTLIKKLEDTFNYDWSANQ